MQIGIVGLPLAGKSTLFQTITKTHLDPSALVRPEAHHAVVKVPDPRLDRLSGLFSPKSTVNAAIEFVDVAGLKRGETGSTQFTTNFLANVKTNDALVHVVRAFDDPSIPHPDGSVDPARDVASFDAEFILADLALIETRVERIHKQLQKTNEELLRKELPLLERCRKILDSTRPLRSASFAREELHLLKTYQLLSIKPLLLALNFGESEVNGAPAATEAIAKQYASEHTAVIPFFGKIEREMSELPEEDATAFMADYGIRESALTAIIRAAYTLLGLQSFFTVGEDECRAWTIKKGMTAQEAAGAIHSDLAERFIRAETVHYDDFISHAGSFAKAKEAGHWRLEGKEYIVHDGDILTIRHS